MVEHVLILAGGSGTRLWPASSEQKPKQFLKIVENKSLLQLTVERALSLGIDGSIYIITLENQLEAVIKECKSLRCPGGKIKIIAEPASRNTAPAVTLAARYLELMGEERSTVLVLPADHIVLPVDKFVNDVKAAFELSVLDYLVTFGVKPDRPETGYGYLEIGKKKLKGFCLKSFKEKPDRSTAEFYLKKTGFFWNSGMFAFRIKQYLNEVKSYSPDIASAFEPRRIKLGVRRKKGFDVICGVGKLKEIYEKVPKISIDYAVMEKSSKAVMVKASFVWNDIGSWDEISRLKLEDDRRVIEKNSKNNFFFSYLSVELCGIDNIIVVVKEGRVLVCKKGESQGVKEIAEDDSNSGVLSK